MSELYHKVLMWHKLIALVTGGLALCSAKHKLNREDARSWVTLLRNVADEIESVLEGGPFLLDAKGQRMVGSEALRGCASDEAKSNGLGGDLRPTGTAAPQEGRRHEVATKPSLSEPERSPKRSTVSPRKIGGVRVATRKRQ